MAGESKDRGGGAKGGARRKTAASGAKVDTADRVVAAAFDMAVARGWQSVTLNDVAESTGLSLAEVYRLFPSKTAILDRFVESVDAEVLAAGAADLGEPPRDRLFDVLMRRFDALNPRKDAVASILNDLAGDPLAAAASLPAFLRSMGWMLEAAGLSASGAIGALRVKGLAAIWLDALRVWLHDDSPDMARTMAALDRNLRRAERLVRMCPPLPGMGRHCRPRRSDEPAAAD